MAYSLRTDKTWSETKAQLIDCLRKWGASNYELECDVRMYTSASKEPVKLRIVWKDGREIFWSYNQQDRPMDNLRVLYLAADAMRLNEARGIGNLVQEAYLQLASPAKERDPWEVLGLRPGASADEIDAMYRVKAKTAHPDAGGSDGAMKELNDARERAKAQAARR